jgi:hypothetical protein
MFSGTIMTTIIYLLLVQCLLIFSYKGFIQADCVVKITVNCSLITYIQEMGFGQCCGSESEIIRMFWLDPNPDKKFGFGYGFGFRHCCRMKIFVKNQTSNT